MDQVLYTIAGLACAFICFCNWEDEEKAEFSRIVALSILISVLVAPAFPDKSIHIASIAYNFIIFSLLVKVRCLAYMNLCYLYAISIVNEVMMYASLVWLDDMLFSAGHNISLALVAMMVVGLAKDSNGTGGFFRYVRHIGDRRRARASNHHNHVGR